MGIHVNVRICVANLEVDMWAVAIFKSSVVGGRWSVGSLVYSA